MYLGEQQWTIVKSAQWGLYLQYSRYKVSIRANQYNARICHSTIDPENTSLAIDGEHNKIISPGKDGNTRLLPYSRLHQFYASESCLAEHFPTNLLPRLYHADRTRKQEIWQVPRYLDMFYVH